MSSDFDGVRISRSIKKKHIECSSPINNSEGETISKAYVTPSGAHKCAEAASPDRQLFHYNYLYDEDGICSRLLEFEDWAEEYDYSLKIQERSKKGVRKLSVHTTGVPVFNSFIDIYKRNQRRLPKLQQFRKQLQNFLTDVKTLNETRYTNGEDTTYFDEYVIALSEENGQYYLDRIVKPEKVGYMESIVQEMTPGFRKPDPSHHNTESLHWCITEEMLDDESILQTIIDKYNTYLSMHLLSDPTIDAEGIRRFWQNLPSEDPYFCLPPVHLILLYIVNPSVHQSHIQNRSDVQKI